MATEPPEEFSRNLFPDVAMWLAPSPPETLYCPVFRLLHLLFSADVWNFSRLCCAA